VELKRKVYEKLLDWKAKSKGRTAVLLSGARRTGKSYIVSLFAKREYQSHILIDFSLVPQEIKDVFESDYSDLDLFFMQLSLFYRTKLHEHNSLIIFDEVQLYPKARQLIKHLVADGRYDFIETGSLLSIRHNTKDILIPSEEEEIVLHPLDFEEFLWANGDEATVPLIKECFERRRPLGQAVNRSILKVFREYMVVGGMPQAVVEYMVSKDLEQVDAIKRNILRLYKNDATKYAVGYENKVLAIFEEIPSQLGKKEKKFTLSQITKKARMREYESAFYWLDEANIATICFNSVDPNVGLKINSERTTIKCYLCDTGLLVTHSLDEENYLDGEVYRSIMLGKLSINEGAFAENVVAQAFVANGKKLYFYSRFSRDDSNNTMEIDFLIREGKKVVPVEVKSGAYKGHRSLDKFKNKFSNRIGTRYVLHTKDIKVDGDIIYLPIYMAMFL